MYSLWAVVLLVAFNVVYSLDLPECKHIECADYKVIEKKANYEIRRYESYKIVSVLSKGVPWFVANWYNFMKLFKFIGGHNSKSLKMKMTAPVLNIVNMNEETGEPIKDETEMAFFMSKHLDGAVPKPLDATLKVKDFGPVTVYAVTFGGYTTTRKVLSYQKKLHDDLKKDGVAFDESYFATAGYNAPFQLWHRHNDVFYMSSE